MTIYDGENGKYRKVTMTISDGENGKYRKVTMI
jgi:hypothetical protein